MMSKRAWLGTLTVTATGIAVAIAGCTGDTINNYQDPFGVDSGFDAQLLQSLGCTPGKKECVTDTVARVCPADGTLWVGVTCRVGEKCDQGDCKPVAGGPTAACVPGDGACTAPNKALRCKNDGSGFVSIDCPPNTTCFDKGLCKGTQIVGTQTCSTDRKSVMESKDGFTSVKVADCAATDVCVQTGTVPYTTVACKPAQCDPAATCGGATPTTCGDPLNPGADQTKSIATCKETPDGFKWVGQPCPVNQTCNPVGTTCNNQQGKFQAACGNPSSCTPGTTRCAFSGNAVQTCQPDGTWATPTACNLGAGEVCMTPYASGKQVCGHLICQFNGGAICDDATGQIRACDDSGKLTLPKACTFGRCIHYANTNLPAPYNQTGRCTAECTPGTEDCGYFGGNNFRICDANGRWGQPQVCPSDDGAASTCTTYTDPVSNLSKHLCVVGIDCTPGQRRCVSTDGGVGTEAIQACGTDGRWGAPAACAVGVCTATVYGTTCLGDCTPGSQVCDPTGSGKFLVCPANGKLPVSPTYDQTCSGTMSCKRSGNRSFGCLECVGPSLTDGNTLVAPESRCLADDGGVNGSTMLQTCSANNTWDTAATCSGGSGRCSSTYITAPFTDPGGVRFAYCN
ncbi:MAG: hypothetical protein U0235_19060 [Polyangiaceae bacterium]